MTKTTYPTKEMIEAGAKAAYGTVMFDEENWPTVSGSVDAETYRQAAKNCFLAMIKTIKQDPIHKNDADLVDFAKRMGRLLGD